MSRDARIAAYVALGVLVACFAANFPFLVSYAVRGDTAALMLHSTRFFPADVGDWLRHGFEHYFVNFPEANRPSTGFVRPMVNVTIWLESLLAPGPNSAIFLATNYLGHAACAGMVYLAARRIGEVTERRALLAAALFGGTLAAVELLQSPAFRADMLAAGFSLAALLAVDGWRRGRGWMLELAVLLLLLAVLSKETAVTAPFLVAGWAMFAPGERPRRGRIAAALVLLLPLVVFALLRAGGPEGAYMSATNMRDNVAQAATSAFFPGGGVLELLTVLRGRAPSPLEAARMLLAFALNVAALGLAGRALLRLHRRTLVLGVMAAAAFAVPALLAPAPRMLYFGQMFVLPLFAALLPRSRGAARGLAVLALVAGPVWLLGSMAADQPAQVAANEDSRELQDVLAGTLRHDSRVRRVYLVSDVAGDYGALAMLEIATLGAGRPDVAPRVVSSMGRFGDAPRRGTLELRRGGGELVIDQRCGPGCDFSFPGLWAGDEGRLGVPGVIDYRVAEARRLVVAIPERGCDVLLVGFTPAADGVHVLRPCGTAWRRAVFGIE